MVDRACSISMTSTRSRQTLTWSRRPSWLPSGRPLNPSAERRSACRSRAMLHRGGFLNAHQVLETIVCTHISPTAKESDGLGTLAEKAGGRMRLCRSRCTWLSATMRGRAACHGALRACASTEGAVARFAGTSALDKRTACFEHPRRAQRLRGASH